MKKLKHVAIIVDGNGRWAKERGKVRSEGHKKGSEVLEELILHINKNTDIEVASFYVFSTENFKRDEKEVNYLMNLFILMFNRVKEKYMNENIKIIFSGERDGLSQKVLKSMDTLVKDTKNNTGLIVNFCLNYGGRREIVSATKKIVNKVINKEISIDDIDEDLFSKNLYNKLPDVDFMIRTSGEQRLSNFLLWELSYAELYFENTYFPDFTIDKFDEIIKKYYERDRRFGSVK